MESLKILRNSSIPNSKQQKEIKVELSDQPSPKGDNDRSSSQNDRNLLLKGTKSHIFVYNKKMSSFQLRIPQNTVLKHQTKLRTLSEIRSNRIKP